MSSSWQKCAVCARECVIGFLAEEIRALYFHSPPLAKKNYTRPTKINGGREDGRTKTPAFPKSHETEGMGIVNEVGKV